jgi:iron-only hydrogenase group A
MQIKINDKIYDFEKGETVLGVCRRNDIYIPTLCYHDDLFSAEGVCRLCLVKTNKHRGLTTSCQTKAEEYMEVITEDDDIEKARRYNLELLWADHAGKCNDCLRNGNCELQDLAKKFKIDVDDFVPSFDKFEKEEQLKVLKENLKNRVVDNANPSIYRDNQYCIECRRCINACKQIQTIESYGMNHRSIETKVGTPGEIPLDCIFCGQCTLYCPTAAITEKDNLKEVEEALLDNSKMTIFQVAPSVKFTLGEEFGLDPGTLVEGKIVSVLREIGADLVFDTTFSADLTIMEEAHELIQRITLKGQNHEVKIPMFTSCCPSWVLYVEKYWPQFLGNLSSCKSPQQMLGALIKTYYAEKNKINRDKIEVISVMPCTAKKYEAGRKEMSQDGDQEVDWVMTTREFARLIKSKKINFEKLPDSDFDQSLGIHTGAGILFGSTGGVMEAALRTAYESITCEELEKLDFKSIRGDDGIREAEITIPKSKCSLKPLTIKVAVAHEIRNAKKILEKLDRGECDYDFVEIMACPSGCLGGGGQPIPTNSKIRAMRKKAIYDRDKNLSIRKSHENKAVQEVYKNYLGEPGSELAEKLLHTKYFDKGHK